MRTAKITTQDVIESWGRERAALKREVARLRKALREARRDAEYILENRHVSGAVSDLARTSIARITATLARKARHARR